MNVSSGMNLVDLVRIAIVLGCVVVAPKGTGEVRFSHSLMQKPVKQHFGRPGTRAVVVWLRQLIRKHSGT